VSLKINVALLTQDIPSKLVV